MLEISLWKGNREISNGDCFVQGVVIEMKYEGRVKWFNDKRGFGFIESPQYHGDIMAHYSEIKMDGFKKLRHGQVVRFGIKQEVSGMKAINIEPLCK